MNGDSLKESAANWAKELASGLVSIEQLKKNDLLQNLDDITINEIKNNFDIRIPHIFLNEIINNNEVLKKQFVPTREELFFLPEELEDPIGDEIYAPLAGLTHRYPDRVLFKPTYMCAGYCRFCFRRYRVSHTEYNLTDSALEKIFAYIQSHREINEIILSGGDPLTLTNKALEKILNQFIDIKHVKILRFHTRIPSLLPSRIDSKLIQILKNTKKTIWIVAHINHVAEFTLNSIESINMCIDNGIPVLMQSVLLKGINDSTQNLSDLLQTAILHRIKPYYLHYPDLALGTQHFRIPLHEAIEIVKNLRGKISGLCIPHFMIDIPGGKGKIAINPHLARQLAENIWEFESPLDGKMTKVIY